MTDEVVQYFSLRGKLYTAQRNADIYRDHKCGPELKKQADQLEEKCLACFDELSSEQKEQVQSTCDILTAFDAAVWGRCKCQFGTHFSEDGTSIVFTKSVNGISLSRHKHIEQVKHIMSSKDKDSLIDQFANNFETVAGRVNVVVRQMPKD